MCEKERCCEAIETGKTALGIEFGSTRIKAVLSDLKGSVLAIGTYDWENKLEDGIWTYSLEDIHTGLQSCYKDLSDRVKAEYGISLQTVGAMGISAMMHGYLAFNDNNELLVPFRTWRNTITKEAADQLTSRFHYNIPQRWSIAHLYQAILNEEEHVKDISFVATLAAYVHWQLTGEKLIGVGDGSGMFPIDPKTGDYDAEMAESFRQLIAEKGYSWSFPEIFPANKNAGEQAGCLTEAGARLLDPSGTLKAGIPFCPPEGDAGTGMVATNSVRVRTGNVSAGTSAFGMIVLEEELKGVYEEIDMVTTPDGSLVAMAHCNNCTSDLNAWVSLFEEFLQTAGFALDKNQIFSLLYNKALEGDSDCGGLLSYNYYSGEPITRLNEGRPLFMRRPDSSFGLANFMRSHLYASLSVLKTGMDLLLQKEGVKVDNMLGHGGLFKTKGVGQKILAAALNTPVTCMETAGEGGAWGIALLAAYMLEGKGLSLADWLEKTVFSEVESETIQPEQADVEGFNRYLEEYTRGLAAEKAAVESF